MLNDEHQVVAAMMVRLSEELRRLAIASGDAVEELHRNPDPATIRRCAATVAALACRCAALTQELSRTAGRLEAFAELDDRRES